MQQFSRRQCCSSYILGIIIPEINNNTIYFASVKKKKLLWKLIKKLFNELLFPIELSVLIDL